MDPARRDLSIALWGALIFAVMVLLVLRLKTPGAIIAGLIGVTALLTRRRFIPNPEVESLRSSLLIACDDIRDIVEAFDNLQHGSSTQALADRTLHFPALANTDLSVPEISEFHLKYSAAQRFLARVDTYLQSPDLERVHLEKLIRIADERALELEDAWVAARNAAREIGPS